MRRGEAKIVASTHALELGMDIGGLDAVVLAGYPGTRAATWQRAGRAGRRQSPSLTIMVLCSRPLDQFVAAAPEFLFGEPPEHARIDALNPEVLVPHLRCAAYELPFGFGGSAPPAGDGAGKGAGEEVEDEACWWARWGGLSSAELTGALDYLAERGVLLREDQRYYAVGSQFPADGVDLRGSIEENFTVVEELPGQAEHGRILAEVDFEDGPLYLHPGAIYPLEGKIYEVRRLDWEPRKAYVREAAVDYYTEAVSKLRVRMLEADPAPESGAAARVGDPREVRSGTGYAHVVRAVPGFKKLRFRSHENVGFGPVNLPDLELHTVAAYWALPDALLAQLGDPYRRSNAALAAAHAIHHVAAMILMCEVGDLQHAVASATPGPDGVAISTGPRRALGFDRATSSPGFAPVGLGRPSAEGSLLAGGRPTIYLYDDLPGGAGLATRVHALGRAFFERALTVVRGCGCERGCPTCVGTEVALGPGASGQPSSILDPSGVVAEALARPEEVARGHARQDLVSTLEALVDGLAQVGPAWAG
jgi:DEAD/DEAH box helicase domain-containing protein